MWLRTEGYCLRTWVRSERWAKGGDEGYCFRDGMRFRLNITVLGLE